MVPTAVLEDEHHIIIQVLSCLDQMADGCLREGTLDRLAALEVIDFFQTFADRCHHAKEETYLFPTLEAKGFPRHGGPTGVMRAEHDHGRWLLGALAADIDGAAAGCTDALRRFVINARAYTQLLRRHIEKEDQYLFPMAEAALTDEEQQALLKAFDRVEHQDLHPDTHAAYLELADRLADRFGVPRAGPEPTRPHRCGACGHHAVTP